MSLNQLAEDLPIEQFEVFPWNENFNTGYEVIDNQHRKLASLLNRLARTLIEDDHALINTAFTELAEYAAYHFDAEETVWYRYLGSDCWFSSHQLSHASFLPNVVDIKKREQSEPPLRVIEEIVKFLIRWLAFHILDEDKKLSIVVNEISDGRTLEQAKEIADKQMGGSMRVLIETVLKMYDALSSTAIDLLRERKARLKAENHLKAANRMLEELSHTDQLTGLYNRRYLAEIFNKELKRSQREQSRLAYFVVDIDNFKLYNDNYGHPAGDKALIEVAKALEAVCQRSSDYVFRVGGEEFIVLVQCEGPDKCVQFGEKLRSTVENLGIKHEFSTASDVVTISVGALSRVPSSADSFETFVTEADQQLCIAKNTGRNRVKVTT